MNDLNQSDIERTCKQIIDDFRGVLSWKWDNWVGSILSEFNTEIEKDIRVSLEKSLPLFWDSSSIQTAPQIVQTLNNRLGGIRPTQLLFTTPPSNDAFVFCAWWPWGSGMAISLRIAPFNKNLSKSEEDVLTEQLKVWAKI
jgi:hypothetical protein